MSENQEQWRAQHYALLATLLAAPPQIALLDNIAEVDVTEPESAMGQAWLALQTAAKQVEKDALNSEYHALFIGLTQGEIIPYGSFYQTGFLNEKPLALLRKDLAQLGLERQDDKKEPEDHIAAEFDVMRLILSAQGTPVVDASTFFNRHIQPWAERFFSDLAVAKNAVFYRSVAGFANQFIKLETQLLK
ncbi:putative formate dehydrogenase-specific chaperone [Methylophaga thiooxydans]|uniref:Putative formate dehydrogenase-specific chaperone n=1 Tax=Methylophaga thiooxydans TaxID=392484 RepID=A0A0A0BH39_9GAMM|nr:molecular chaperone TorD family protein [Methylophaga thiooxydans]KGM07226.1 putative formate dehydrogenase-specific chaperone [Methylophaga thiooxydans]